MEVKVEVHTVHPYDINSKEGKDTEKAPYGSWCTPDSSPIRKPLRQALQLKEKEDHHDTAFELLKIHFSKRKSPDDINVDAIEEIASEELWKPKTDSFEAKSPEVEEDKPKVPATETPQSPVPSSPIRCNKGKGFARTFATCNFLLPIDPQGQTYIIWLLLVTFCYSYNSWCIPLRATFPYQTPDNLAIWMTIDYICDVIYLLDVVAVKPKLMFLHEGFWVDDPKETRKNYIRKTQYKFDVISLLPLDLLYFFLGTDAVILRIPRLLKLQTFWEFHQAMDRVLASPYVVRIGKTLFYIFFLIHLNACAYYAMSAHIGLGSNGFVYDNNGNAYIRCFYFATKTATSIGKNPKPENTIEYLFMTVAWLMGVFVFALLIGQIRDIIATATRARTEYRKRVDNCIRYLRRLNMPNYLQRRVTCWFNYTWTKQRCFDEQTILDCLPFNMKRDVALAVHMSTLSKVQLFRDCSTSLLRDLVLQLKPVTFLPGELVVRRGDRGHHMYIIKSGSCLVMSPDENEVLATLKEGCVFGEISLLGIPGLSRRTATVRSLGYSNLFALSRSDLNTALEHHKEAAQILRLRADQIIRENAERQTKQRLEKRRSAGGSGGEDGSVIWNNAERQTKQRPEKRSAGGNGGEDGRSGLRRRRSGRGLKMYGRRRTASCMSKRRLSVVSEDQHSSHPSDRSEPVHKTVSWLRDKRDNTQELPTIVLSTD